MGISIMIQTLPKPTVPESVPTISDPIPWTVNGTFYGMVIVRLGHQEYVASTIAQAELSARTIARECLDLIDTDLFLQHSTLPPEAKALVKFVQHSIATGIGLEEEVKALIPVIRNLDVLVEEAVTIHGRSHFLGYFNHPNEMTLADIPTPCADLIRRELQVQDDQDICVYQMC